jgi:hypothetical protein
MSSTTRTHSEIPSRARFLYAVATTTNYTLNSGYLPKSIMTSNEFSTTFSTAPTSATASMYRDMGGEVNVINADSKQRLATFRRVQKMLGTNTEGVLDEETFYICTWTANPAAYSVTVVRAG